MIDENKTTSSRKIYLDLNNFNDDITLKVLPYINNLIHAIDEDEIKTKYPNDERLQLQSFVNQFLNIVYDYPGPVSTHLINNQIEYCETISTTLAKRVCEGPNENELFFKDMINDFDSFYLPIKLSLDLFNATRFMIQDLDDVYTVSTLILMNMITILNLKQKDFRFKMIKLVGRKNEYDLYYAGIKEVELDYELYYQKNIIDSTIQIMNNDVLMLMDAYTAATLMNEECSEIVGNIKSNLLTKEEVEENISNIATFVSEQIFSIMEGIQIALEEKRFKITPLAINTLNNCLIRYEHLALVYDDIFNTYDLEFNMSNLEKDCEKKVTEYLEILGYNL